jgi:hypothetical protein
LGSQEKSLIKNPIKYPRKAKPEKPRKLSNIGKINEKPFQGFKWGFYFINLRDTRPKEIVFLLKMCQSKCKRSK